MCGFCNKCDMGNGEGITSLKTEWMNLGIFGEGQVELEMSVEKDGAQMTAWFSYYGGSDIGASAKIKYCPFCGRDLSEVSENGKQ